jgi:hypothetical protein
MGKSKDPIRLAKDFFDQFLTTADPDSVNQSAERNTQAKESGRLGGLKGGKARADKLSPKERSEISKKAAETRWLKKKLRIP